MRMKTTFAVLALSLAPAGAAFATDYYVAPPGTVQSCTADGSQSLPLGWVLMRPSASKQDRRVATGSAAGWQLRRPDGLYNIDFDTRW